MMYHALRGLGQTPADVIGTQSPSSDLYAGTDALGGPASATDLSSSTATADCDPTSQVCHWYCYIPFMATADCLASFETGTAQLTKGAVNAAGGVVSAFGQGIVAGAANAITGNNNNALSISTGLMLAVGGGLLALVILMPRR